MGNRELHDALRDFALESAKLLREDQLHGAEIQFDLDEGRGSGAVLYHYRPLTAEFIGERWHRLRMLPSREPAAEVLGSGAAAYLRVNGMRGGAADPALRAMLERLYEDATDLTFPEDRFERVYAEVERTLFEHSQPATVLVPVHGLAMEIERVDLGDGVALVRGDRCDAPDEAIWGDPAGGEARSQPNTLLTLEREVTPEDPLPVEEALRRFRVLLTGLRLLKPGGVALAAVAWRRTGEGRWQPFELESTGSARGEPWIFVEGEEHELADVLDAVIRSTHGGRLAWAMSRFEMGCGRRLESEALSDYLLALRALLDGPDGERSAGLALRVAVLCAEESERKRVQRRVELAQALERFVIGDGASDDYLDAVGSDSPRTLVAELERHLRALLRDVLCGYLDPDLARVADDMLLDQPEPFEIRAQAMSRYPEPEPESEPEPVPEVAPEPQRFRASEPEWADIEEEQDRLDDPAFWSAPV
ncbi:MAG TPA: hypothetical protein VFD31_02795 [Thermoleophilaceae bacterium]|nr:hypothetical protein [Thermoleophilaceae bacterium]